jgi:hypothetical protein
MMELPNKTDALYFTDTYGVFFNDWYTGINKSRKSRMLYGGLNNNDYLLVNEMKNKNKLIEEDFFFSYYLNQSKIFRIYYPYKVPVLTSSI